VLTYGCHTRDMRNKLAYFLVGFVAGRRGYYRWHHQDENPGDRWFRAYESWQQ
jgi:hypothetical protein